MNFERARRRYGAKEAARRFKSIKGSLQADRLLDLAIMDHTDVDCWVIDDVTHQPIGRPRITFLIDSCSRYPLGFHIGWKSAGLEAALACLRHALPKKVNLKAKYPEIEHEWLAYGHDRAITAHGHGKLQILRQVAVGARWGGGKSQRKGHQGYGQKPH